MKVDCLQFIFISCEERRISRNETRFGKSRITNLPRIMVVDKTIVHEIDQRRLKWYGRISRGGRLHKGVHNWRIAGKNRGLRYSLSGTTKWNRQWTVSGY